MLSGARHDDPVARLGVGIELVGRRQELSALSAALAAASGGHPAGVLLSGDAGVGKSRLVAEAVERATAAGFTVLVGRCLDTAEASLPYLPFTEIVGALAAAEPDLVAGHAALRHLLPGGSAGDRPGAENRDLGQLRVFDAVLSVLDDLSATVPVLVVLEDLHWSDRSSRDLLVFLLSRLAGQRVVVVATYRTDDLHRRHPLRPVLSELVRLPRVERIDLAPLDAARLARALAAPRRGPPPPAPPSPKRSCATRPGAARATRSSPRSWCRPGRAGCRRSAELLVARVEGLAAGTQRVLRIASVAGRRVHHDQLAAVAGVGIDELEQALRDAVAHHVLVAESAAHGDAYVFRHALLREAVYHELLPG